MQAIDARVYKARINFLFLHQRYTYLDRNKTVLKLMLHRCSYSVYRHRQLIVDHESYQKTPIAITIHSLRNS